FARSRPPWAMPGWKREDGSRTSPSEPFELLVELLVVVVGGVRDGRAVRGCELAAALPPAQRGHDDQGSGQARADRHEVNRAKAALVRRNREGRAAVSLDVARDDRILALAMRHALADLVAGVLGPAAATGRKRESCAIAALAEQLREKGFFARVLDFHRACVQRRRALREGSGRRRGDEYAQQ